MIAYLNCTRGNFVYNNLSPSLGGFLQQRERESSDSVNILENFTFVRKYK